MSRENDLSTLEKVEDVKHHSAIRPQRLDQFIGHEDIKKNLAIFMQAAKLRSEPVDHILLYGPPGLGKTTLAQIVASEMGSTLKQTVGPALVKTGDLAAILTSMNEGDILFIDEVHRMNPAVEEMLYSAMEDFAIDIVIGEGAGARAMRLNLPHFTLIGATTRLGLLSKPFQDRFGIPLKLNFYSNEAISGIIKRASGLLDSQIDADGIMEIAYRSRGTPRIALRLLRRVRDYAICYKRDISDGVVKDFVRSALDGLKIDKIGLDVLDMKYIGFIMDHYDGGPVGVQTIAAALAEDRDTIEDTIEPYLMQIGFLNRTSRGRELSVKCRQHMDGLL